VPPLPDGYTAVKPNEWLPVWDRVIAASSVKVVGYAAARFAGWTDGANIRPGNAILARICGCSTRTAERSLAEIRDMGLMFRYHKGNHQGDADVYRLTFPADALARIPLLDVNWDLPTPDTVSGADSLSGADTVSVTPDTMSAAHPTQCRRTSTETFPISLQAEGEGFDLAGLEVAHAREVNREMDDPVKPEGVPAWLPLECPHCHAAPGNPCTNPGTGGPTRQAHDARTSAAHVLAEAS
jgi:hypothetical protein